MEQTTVTQILRKPDGSEVLVLRRAVLQVAKGPDKGASIVLEQPRVRVGTGDECELRLTDPAVSRCHLEVRATDHGYEIHDAGSTNGTYLGRVRLQRVLITEAADLRLGSTVLRLAPGKETVEIALASRGSFGELLGQSQAMRRAFAMLERVAMADTTVLLEGESGTGKELAARAIHESSGRADGPFVVVDNAGIPPSLIESELFGHERGAFTGAQEARAGALELADAGTLFLDEIGELPPELQPRLLRFLENQEVKRVGSARYRRVRVRVIAATNRNLLREVEQRRFRQDLYYRLAVIRVELPPLRERREDIPLLAHHFAESFAREPQALITEEIRGLLQAYDWPGNVRELRNVVERLAVLPDQARQLMAEMGGQGRSTLPSIGQLLERPFHEARTAWQEHFERQYLEGSLARAGGVVTRAAELAGLPRQSFHRLLSRHGIRGSE